jgi:hypothetical protein
MDASGEPERLYAWDVSSPATTDDDAVAPFVGVPGVFRIGFASMQVLGMPDELQVGRVKVRNTIGPAETQRTTVLQKPGFEPVYDKWMEHPLVGRDRPLTIYSLDVTIPQDVSNAFNAWRNEVLAAAGFLSMVLDERLAQEPLLEDVVVSPSKGCAPVYLDMRRLIRTYEPSNPWFERYATELARFEAEKAPDELHAACRWYLRGAAAGPTADGIVLLWIALECIVPSDEERSRNQVRKIEDAFRRANPELDPKAMIDPSVGHLAGLRARIVHKGQEDDPLIKPGFYTLEALTRSLLRDAFGVADAWPVFPDTSMLREELASMPRVPSTVWRR